MNKLICDTVWGKKVKTFESKYICHIITKYFNFPFSWGRQLDFQTIGDFALMIVQFINLYFRFVHIKRLREQTGEPSWGNKQLLRCCGNMVSFFLPKWNSHSVWNLETWFKFIIQQTGFRIFGDIYFFIWKKYEIEKKRDRDRETKISHLLLYSPHVWIARARCSISSARWEAELHTRSYATEFPRLLARSWTGSRVASMKLTCAQKTALLDTIQCWPFQCNF